MIRLGDLLPEDSDAAKEAHEKGLVAAGWGYWKDKSGNTVAKTVNGKLQPLNGKQAPTKTRRRVQQKAVPPQTPTNPVEPSRPRKNQQSVQVMMEHSKTVKYDDRMEYAAQWYANINYHHVNTCLRKYKGDVHAYVVESAIENGDAQPGEDVTKFDQFYKNLEKDLSDALGNLDKLLLQNPPIPAPIQLYRGSGWQSLSGIKMPRQGMHDGGIAADAKRQAAEKIHQLKGSILKDNGYTSTSLDPEIAQKWRRGAMDTVIMEIEAPKGTHGVFLDYFEWNQNQEEEVLLPRNTQFRIKEITGDLVTAPIVMKLEVVQA